VNPSHLAFYASGIAVVAILGGRAFSRRLRWPHILTALLYFALSLATFVFTVLLVIFNFELDDDHGVTWIENLGIALAAVSGGSLIACLYFFTTAGVVAIRRALKADKGTGHLSSSA
jgi:hypothetical protein